MTEEINGYLLHEPLKTDNSGFSKWGFAWKNGREYFIKEFLSPVYPVDPELLGAELTEKKREVCRTYSERMRLLYQKINQCSDGNLVRVEHFFRWGSRFYIVTEKIDEVDFSTVQKQPLAQKFLLCMILAHALGKLHEGGLVHSDVKLSNILLCRTPAGTLGARIIDVDSCFLESDPPKGDDEIIGDQVYMAPETFRLMATEEGRLTHKIDTFALGLIFYQIFTGNLPHFDHTKYNYIYEALMDGQPIDVRILASPEASELIRQMLQPDPAQRPELTQVCRRLAELRMAQDRPAGAYGSAGRSYGADANESEHGRSEAGETAKEERAFAEARGTHRRADEFFFRAGEDDL